MCASLLAMLGIMAPFWKMLCAFLVYPFAGILKVLPTPVVHVIWTVIVVYLEFGLVLESMREAWRDRNSDTDTWKRLWIDVSASWGRARHMWESDYSSLGAACDPELRQAESKH